MTTSYKICFEEVIARLFNGNINILKKKNLYVYSGRVYSKPIAIARLSMLLLFYQCPAHVWSILSHLRLAFSINTTKDLYRAATRLSIADRMNWSQHVDIAVVGADNCSFLSYCMQLIVNGVLQTYHIYFFFFMFLKHFYLFIYLFYFFFFILNFLTLIFIETSMD